MRKTLIALTAVSALAFSTSAFAFQGNGGNANGAGSTANGNGNHVNIGSSLLNIGGQNNGGHSVSGVLNEESVTGNGATGIYNNASPVIDF